ncbi:glycine/betaine ABC transporter substrate-binding protein [Prauserella sp. PE36]|uniref:Glycine betaine ABC transporter substrate-binding protein n=1 Tax=Prauserella endophytica TaxID=1592324 RepID=A0ABY2SCW1_9PSEU|nr:MULTISPECIES: glycine betaine ABC transporter substrate-binding protein [Prauserella]PXY34863.1 glycine/betaine ABC transporter substrate-binding protein [Prauserella coralliicola]RBM19358.1 glycine/betaine ABC transporter substrate-binding protein [Prauserella sp. PE36]TKG73391.1 glycine betaine ABC transporter substrate-binding protein [Prauserella endophytica]
MRRKLRAVLGAALLMATTSACGLTVNAALPFDVQPGSIRPVPELEGVDVTVGSKDFTEQIILGYIAELALEAAGANAIDLTNINGSNSSRYALIDGQIDLQWEYTGTGWLSYLGYDKPLPEEDAQYEAVRKADLEQNGIVWLPYSEVNNTYAFATTEAFAQKHNLKTTTDMTNFLKENPQEGVFCVETEFASRPDGMPGVQKTYGFDVTTTKTFGTGAIYSAIAGGTCKFGEVFTTDGRIAGLNLRVLQDDKKFFPQYNASVTLRKEFLDQYPQIADVMAPVTEALNNDEIIELNKRVDVDGEDPAKVARDWMIEKGFIN